MSEQTQKHVFISYVRENQKQVDRLCLELESNGVKVWQYRNSIKPGARWKDAIRKAIRRGDFFIACFSNEYASKTKTYMNEELTLAIEELRQYGSDREWFIPVLLSECDVPARSIGGGETLLDIQWVPLFDDWEGGIKRIVEVIEPIPQEVQAAINAIQLKDNGMRMSAVSNLGNIGHTSAAASLAALLKDNDKDICIAAAISLGKIGGPIAIQALTAALNDKNINFSSIVVEALAKIGEPAVPELVKILSSDQDASSYAVEALKKIGDCTVKTLENAMLNEKNNLVKRLIVDILSHIIGENEEKIDRCEGSISALKKALMDKDEEIRWSAAIALGKLYNQLRIPKTKKVLAEASQKGKQNVRFLSIDLLGKIGGDIAKKALKSALNDEDETIRRRAANSLNRLGKKP